jgi:polysaccharide deacetylase family protein (PEP-CTERM system associated)
MTVDVEDFFQVQAFAQAVPRDSWDRFSRRVEANTDRILTLFDEAKISGTFFTLGWIAERHPGLIRRIVEKGHEIASHGYAHIRIFEQSPAQFRDDVRRTKAILEDIGGVAVQGYRAASFSMREDTLWALCVLGEEGYRYSSSIYPISHDHYGIPSAPRFAFEPDNCQLLEIPMTTTALLGRNFPCAGGGYFRLLPYAASRWAMRRVNRRDRQPCVFYFHPWELDPKQPKIQGISVRSRFRHYINLDRMEAKLLRLLRDFRWTRLDHLLADWTPRADS